MTAALMAGGREYLGWGVDRHMMADLFDALNFNTKATGNWKKNPPDLPHWPRPTKAPKGQAEKPKVTLADLHRQLSRR